MRPLAKATLAAGAGLLAVWVGWGAYVRRTTERVPYDRLDGFDGVELRRYPRTVLVETTAPDPATAFRRLFRYLRGANERGVALDMTAPVATRGEGGAELSGTRGPTPTPWRRRRADGESVSMTAPVRTDRRGDAVTMAFYLPAAVAPETAPSPTDPSVRLVVEPPRTVAARRFAWYATPRRVDRARRRLLDGLADRSVETRGEPVLLQYDPPWTPPFVRRNEVAVDVRDVDGPTAG